jgi:hypothetical protein
MIGYLTGLRVTSGSYNVLVGEQAGSYITTASGNTSIGESEGARNNGNYNTAVG